MRLVTLILLCMSFVVGETSIDQEIEAIRNAPVAQRFQKMNAFKERLIRMRQGERIEAMRKLQRATGNAQISRLIDEIKAKHHRYHRAAHPHSRFSLDRSEFTPDPDNRTDTTGEGSGNPTKQPSPVHAPPNSVPQSQPEGGDGPSPRIPDDSPPGREVDPKMPDHGFPQDNDNPKMPEVPSQEHEERPRERPDFLPRREHRDNR